MEKRVLIARWLPSDTQPIPIYDEASVSSARQRVREAGERLNLTKEVIEKVALMASELTHNQLSHARQGYFAVKPVEREGVKGLEITAADIGPGIQEPTAAFKDQMSATGSLGAGLGAVLRIADEIEVDDRISEGFCIVARKFQGQTASPSYEFAIMGKPYPGEAISGDDGVLIQSEFGFLAAVSDGLGHGPEARQASNRAIQALIERNDRTLDQLTNAINDALIGTRGCAMSIVRFTKASRTFEAISLGDVHSHLYNLRDAHFFASTPLILGEGKLSPVKLRLEKTLANPSSILVMFTDGLKSRTSLKGELDILRKPAISIAEYLLDKIGRAHV